MILTWFGQSGWQIKTNRGKIIYIDPWMGDYKNQPKADLILITHSHHDHSDLAVIQLLKKGDTVVITIGENASKISAQSMSESEKKILGDIEIEAVPAYNIHKPYHPRGVGLGFILTIDGKKIYHAGDTDVIPEMKNLANIDVVLLPIGGTYTMNTQEALEAIKLFNPKIVIPMHYNTPNIGLEADENAFKTEVENQTLTKVIILKPNLSYEL